MDVAAVAAFAYLIATLMVVGFQVMLALGAPWGAYAMGGRSPGRFSTPMRAAAVGQAIVLSLFALAVLSAAGLLAPGLASGLPWLIWVVVAVAGASVIMNAASRSRGERRLWVPVGLVMLGSSLVVALSE